MNEHFVKMMMERHNTNEAGVRRIMRERGKKGPQAREARLKAEGRKHVGGFSDPEFARQAGEKGRAVRFGKPSLAGNEKD